MKIQTNEMGQKAQRQAFISNIKWPFIWIGEVNEKKTFCPSDGSKKNEYLL